ncbi:LAFE_0C08086g1_1 [Lachancea fermentati]|uniref:LAFE_0C08086g1_1 n=1 Tax=Lachancea fermentati TaxID=4955 RepID=A0A1G4MA29_LACFM|nr:LAFE_0C08086g1_1 [Lachancea fermentati]
MGRPPKRVSQENIERFQSELEEAGQDVELLLKDKKGRSRSCLLCQRRKRRCDHKLPSCTACLKAAVKCIQPAKYVTKTPQSSISAQQTPAPNTSQTRNNKDGKDEYARFLEKKLKYLEKMLDLPPNGASFKNKLSNYKRIAHLLDTGDGNLDTLPLLQRVMYTDPSMAPPVSSSSSPILPPPQKPKIFPLTGENLVNKALITPPNIQPPTSLAALSTDTLESIDFSKCIFAKYNLKEFLRYDPAFEFEEQLSRAFLDIYFTRLQFKYPLLDEQEIYSFHKDYISNNVHSYSTQEFHFACGRMWLIFSISACLHKSTGKYRGLPPNRYFSTAIRHITKCGSVLTYIQQVEVLTLLVLYIIRTDRDSIDLYEIIGDVMAICKDKLFLNKWNPQDTFANKKLRLFWCVYLLERMICVAVGKPYTIPESEIDLPFFNEDSFNTNSISHQKRHKRGVHFINQSLKLRRIESEFVETLQSIPQFPVRGETVRTTSELAQQLPLVKKFFHDLEVWRSNCSTSHVRNFENETLKLYYYRSVRLLIQPYLELLEPEDRLFRECQAAAGQICQLYKIFHQKTVYGHSTPAVHTVFVAGVTLIYCMWLARNLDDERRRKLGDDSKHTRPLISPSLFSTLDDLRACSVCLYVMAERSKFAIIFRDTFDQLMNATIGNLIERCGPDSAELVYIATSSSSEADITPCETNDENLGRDMNNLLNQPEKEGMPPAIRRTFGKFQANEHVGFVENSQIDPAEQRELQKKQGDLEKVAVPKKLSYLLVKDEEPEHEVLPKGTPERKKPATSLRQKEKDKYMVKKPPHISESDWEGFQQQAFLQQHHAQQTLQAYLASLNKKITSEVTGYSLPPYGSVQENNTLDRQIPSASTISGATGVVNELKQIPPSTENSSSAWDHENARAVQNQNFGVMGNMAVSPLNSPSFLQRPISNVSPNSLDAGEILFNNGAHTMINNISSWTNDSVAELINTRHPEQEVSSSANDMMGNGTNKNNLMGGRNETSENHLNILPAEGNWRADNQSRSNSQSQDLSNYPSQQAQRTNDVSNSQQIQSGAQVDTVFGMPVEEFWTVNDDYGFLA